VSGVFAAPRRCDLAGLNGDVFGAKQMAATEFSVAAICFFT